MKLGRHIVRAAVAVPVLGIVAFGCGWPIETKHTVRFNWDMNSRDELMRMPPLRAREVIPRNAIDDDRYWHYGGEDDENGADEAKRIDALWDDANEAVQRGDLRKARTQYEAYLRLTEGRSEDSYRMPESQQARRNSAIDRLDAIGGLDRGASVAAVTAYIAAREVYDLGGDATSVLPLSAGDPQVRDNEAYLAAAFAYHDGAYEQAASEFAAMVARFPRSEKREAALYMTALSNLRLGEWETARRGFARQLVEFPSGRFASEARGWDAHLLWTMERRTEALAAYYRMLASPDDRLVRIAVTSLRLTRPKMEDGEMHEVERFLSSDPRAALAYAYYELYNYAPWLAEEQSSQYADAPAVYRGTRDDNVARIVEFATRMVDRAPRSAVSAAFTLRLAMAQLELGRNADAATRARRAVALGVSGEERARALYIAGCADFRLGTYDSARMALEEALAYAKNDRLVESTRRSLALVCEEAGDLGGALEQYLALDYQLDVAYLTDVLMTPDDLARFVEKHPGGPKRDELQYALGVRYLRAGRLQEARLAYALVRTVDPYETARDPWDRSASPKAAWGCDWSVDGVRARWVAADLQTIDDLEHLRERTTLAQGSEARAEAFYQLASYLYESSDLLFYNPEAWRGFRAELLSQRPPAVAQPNENEVAWRYCKQHEPVSQALAIYLEVADTYPNTRAARDALLSAVYCDDRLAGYSGYWRDAYASGRHAGDRRVTETVLHAAYPDYRLPAASPWSWEPSTRTVNGRPAWLAPPKRKPPKPLWRRAIDRGGALVSGLARWCADAVVSSVRWFVAGQLACLRFWLLTLALLAAGIAARQAAGSARSLAGRRATAAAARIVWAAVRNAVDLGAQTVTSLRASEWSSLNLEHGGARARSGLVRRRRTALAIALYAMPALLALVLLAAVVSRLE